MGALIKIAIRNLREHKAKTIIIGSIVALGIFSFILGNSLMDSATLGIRKSFIENYTADIMVRATSQSPVEITGQAMGPGGMTETTTIPFYTEVYEYLSTLDGVKSAHSQVASMATIDLDDDKGAFTMLFGIEPTSYKQTFPDNLEVIHGRFLEPGETGIVLSKKIWEEIPKELGIELEIGQNLVLQGGFAGGGGGGFGMKIREVPLVGVFEFKTTNSSLENMSLIDVQTLRSLLGMTIGTTAMIEISEDDTSLLSMNEDSMFGEDDIFGGSMFDETEESDAGLVDFDNVLGDTSQREFLAQPDSGAWHYTLMQLEEGKDIEKTINQINRWFLENEISAEAVNWQIAAGALANISSIFQTIFNVVVILIAIGAIFIIMNTLVISVIERTSEIGTMRALGANKGFVALQFFIETMTISLVFGTIGLLLGLLIIQILSFIGLKSTNDIFKLVFGTAELYPVIELRSVIISYVILLLIGPLSSLYPIFHALKISPRQAMSTD